MLTKTGKIFNVIGTVAETSNFRSIDFFICITLLFYFD